MHQEIKKLTITITTADNTYPSPLNPLQSTQNLNSNTKIKKTGTEEDSKETDLKITTTQLQKISIDDSYVFLTNKDLQKKIIRKKNNSYNDLQSLKQKPSKNILTPTPNPLIISIPSKKQIPFSKEFKEYVIEKSQITENRHKLYLYLVKNLVTNGLLYYEWIQLDLLNPQQQETSLKKRIGASLTWLFMFIAHSKQQPFDEGAFVIDDPGYKLYNFLTQLGSYNRLSSHPISEPDEWHQGLDIHPSLGKEINLEEDYLLPSNKKTLLFMKKKNLNNLDLKQIFIKPENNGCRILDPLLFASPNEILPAIIDVFGHSAGLFTSLARRIHPHYFGNNSGEGKRKERIPVNIKESFTKLAASLQMDEATIIEAIQEGKGIRVMLEHIQKTQTNPLVKNVAENQESLNSPPVRIEESKDWEDFMKSVSEYDHLKDRIGEEVIIKMADFTKLIIQ